MNAAIPGALIETEWLESQLEAADLRVFDCTTNLIPDPVNVYRVESGRAAYEQGHIPGAGFIDLQGELSEKRSELRFTLPPAVQFEAVMSEKGVGPGTRVVLYSQTTPQWATRVWWMLRSFGFDHAMVLNGGLTKWKADGRPLSVEPAAYPKARFTAHPRLHLIADKDDVLAARGDASCLVLNALSAEQHRGGGRHYGRPGRIAGSACVPAAEMLDGVNGPYLPLAEIEARMRAAGALAAAKVITYCGGGIAASSTAFLLTILGQENVRLYDGSLSEWVRDPALPMEIG